MTTVLQQELAKRQMALESEIADLERQLEPLQREVAAKRTELGHVVSLMPHDTEVTKTPANHVAHHGTWAAICRDHGWPVNGDSAHRVVMRRDPILHDSYVHDCPY